MQVQDLNYAGYPWIQLTESVATAIAMMEDEQLTHLPVVEENIYQGLVSREALYEVHDDSIALQQLGWPLPRPSVKPTDHFLAALQIMGEQGLSLVPVITDQQEKIDILIKHIKQLDKTVHEITDCLDSAAKNIFSIGMRTGNKK